MLYAVAADFVRAMDSDSGSAGLECVADDGQSSTPASTTCIATQLSLGEASTSGSSSCSSGLPPAPKRTKRASKWQEEWKKYSMKQSKRGASFVHCNICCTDFSIASGGVHEVKRHMGTKKHVELAKQSAGQTTIAATFRKGTSVADQVTAAEIYFSMFIAEHNLPFLAADHFNKLCKVMFPDSKIAQEFACGRTKTTAIVKYALAPVFNNKVVQSCCSSPFTLLCDGGNDQSDRKYFGIMVRYWDKVAQQPVTRFLCMPVCNIATAQSLFNAIEEAFESRNIPWTNMIGYASDTASVMVGKHNSVLSRLLLKQPKLFSLGCLCHLGALCAAAALKTLPVSLDELLIDIFYHFKHSSKRWHEFNEIQHEFNDIKPLRVLKHSTTRWLSLERCLKRLIEQWPALNCYFDRTAESEPDNERVQRVAKQLKDPELKLFCHFVVFVLKPLNIFSTAFQTHASRIGTLQADVRKLLHSFVSNFIDPEVIKSTEDITSIDFTDASIQLSDDELGIGTSTRLLWCGDLEDMVGTALERRFFKCVRTFYETSVSKMITKFPFNNETIGQLAFLDPRNRNKTSINGIIQLASRFTSFSPDEMDSLCLEFRDYRASAWDQLPSFDPKEVRAIDHFWAAMAKVHSIMNSELCRFSVLAKLAQVLLVLPHSNADPERLFSMVRKIETEERRQLDVSTVCDLLSVKINNDNPCYSNKHLINDSMLSKAKSATKESLKKTA